MILPLAIYVAWIHQLLTAFPQTAIALAIYLGSQDKVAVAQYSREAITFLQTAGILSADLATLME